ncbi:T9SS type A sorting domain-containing protein [Hymenobacter sp. BT18]|uniref:alpha-amylase family glycosyl hydrolase n=1 Tax=Hymenobacter sp. BT18 TaxID=2835648 RepID=UPI00143EDEDD|nr:alpha-amylase family glycosyl hydrolase [Hymenobacter sp. BT18]QIX62969.1 T9SS type A sorting domain-containing protein [Hymenobacter sp. BT18]
MKALRLLLLWAVALTGLPAAYAQVVTADPVFFTETTPVTLTFDATKGDAGLKDFAGDVYIWTGVISDKSTSNTDWKAVVGTAWTPPIAKEKMTRSASNPNLYTISFTPRTYYDKLPAGDKILKLAMLFRSADGSKSGRDTGGKDILVDVAQTSALSVRITGPTTAGNTQFVNQNAKVTVTGTASAAATLTLTLNGTQVDQQTNATSLSKEVTLTQSGNNVLKLTATSGSTTATDEINIFASPAATVAALPAGAKKDGVTYLNDGKSAILALTAPGKTAVYAIGEFNDWQPGLQYQLKKTSATDDVNTRWWVQIDGLTPGQEYAYQFQVDGLRIADPYTEKVLDPNNDRFITAATYPNLKAYPTGKATGIVSVLQSNEPAYTWQVTNFQRPSKLDMVVYELLVRDFVVKHDYKTVTDSLDYLKRLGINVLELMPVNEFEGNESWGYNPSFYFAPDKYYGTKNDLKKLIDEAHKRGIAVVLDMVLNHSFGQSPMVQMYSSNSPWFNAVATHPYNVGTDFNHESDYTRYFSKQVIKHWLDEYHVDGYRYDLAGGFSQVQKTEATYESVFDQSRVNIWKDYYAAQQAASPGSYAILETFVANEEAKALSAAGLMLWGKMTNNYNEATMGYNDGNKSDLSWGYYKQRGFTEPNLVTYMESHDEDRLMYKNLRFGNASGSYSTKNLNTALSRMETAGAFFFLVPGPRMIWQFGEVGYDKGIFMCPDGTYPGDNGTDNTKYGKDDGCKLSNKPVLDDYYDTPNRRHLYDVYRSLIALKTSQPVFENTSATFAQNVTGAVKTLHLSDASLSMTVLGNFDVIAKAVSPEFQAAGTWYNYLDGTTLTVAGADVNKQITLQPGEYRVYLSKKVAVPANTVLPTKAERAALALSFTAVPNPAASAVRLQYTLPQTTQVSVSVVNALGATVRTIPVAAKQATGTHELLVPVQDLANGIYIVRLQAAGKVATTRLLVQH